MKKLILFVLMLLAVSSAMAEYTEGQKVEGFTVESVRPFELIDARVTTLVHDETGARVCYIANDDTNRVFNITVQTHAVDNTGLPHIYEHATLGGSEKYPSESLFFNLGYQTYNTYMNASTYSRMTAYPCASLSEAQLLRYADFYTDSVLHPMVLRKESLFRQEAWRYRLEEEEGPLTIEGTVYSEMLGSMSQERQADMNQRRLMFPGSVIAYNQGGDPDAMPELTWQELIDYHEAFYHPSNCVIYLYGEFEHPEAFLSLLDEAFRGYTKKDMSWEDSAYAPISGEVFAEYPYPVSMDAQTEGDATVYYSIRLDGFTDEELLKLNTLMSFLSDNCFPLLHNLQTQLPSGDFSCGVDRSGPDPVLTFIAANIDREEADLFRETVRSSLEEMAQNGLDEEDLDGSMSALALSIRLLREDSSIGLDITENMGYQYAESGNLYAYMDSVEALDRAMDWNRDGSFKALLSKALSCQNRAMSVTYPQPGLREELDAKEEARLAAILEGMSKEEKAALIAASEETEEPSDSTEEIRSLTAVTVESLPEEVKEYPYEDVTGKYRSVFVEASVDGVGMAQIFLPEDHLTLEETQYVALLTELTDYLDTEKHTRRELSSLMNRYFYDGILSLESVGKDDYVPYLILGFTALDKDLEGSYEFVRELLLEGVLDPERIAEAVDSLRMSLWDYLTSMPYGTQLLRSISRVAQRYRYNAWVSSYEYYDFLCRVQARLEEDPEGVVADLEHAREALQRSSGAMTVFCGSRESKKVNAPLAERFLDALPEGKTQKAEYTFPEFPKNEGTAMDISVYYNGYFADYKTLGLPGYTADMNVVASIVTDSFLYPLLRDQYGAYAVVHGANRDGMYVYSYDDPNIQETYGVYALLPQLIQELDLDQETLDGYILSAYAGYAMPQGELSGAYSTALSVIKGQPLDERLQYMRQIKSITPEKVAGYSEVYRRLVTRGMRSSTGPVAGIQKNANLFDAVFRPFAAGQEEEAE